MWNLYNKESCQSNNKRIWDIWYATKFVWWQSDERRSYDKDERSDMVVDGAGVDNAHRTLDVGDGGCGKTVRNSVL